MARGSRARGISYGLDTFSWQTAILTFIEEQNLERMFDYTVHATDLANQPAVNQVQPLANCPSTPRGSLYARGLWYSRGKMNESLTAATSDYASSEGYMDGPLKCVAGAGELVYGASYWETPTVRQVSFKDVTDGLSKTTLLLERAALPDHYFDDGNMVEPYDPPRFRTWGNVGLWTSRGNVAKPHPSRKSPTCDQWRQPTHPVCISPGWAAR